MQKSTRSDFIVGALPEKSTIGKGPSINYVVSAGGEGGKPKDDLVNRPYLIEKTTRGGRF